MHKFAKLLVVDLGLAEERPPRSKRIEMLIIPEDGPHALLLLLRGFYNALGPCSLCRLGLVSVPRFVNLLLCWKILAYFLLILPHMLIVLNFFELFISDLFDEGVRI